MSIQSVPFRRLRRGLSVLAVGVVLAACGGGSEQQEPFVPVRLLAFGDEASHLSPAVDDPPCAARDADGTCTDPGEPGNTDDWRFQAGRKHGVNVVFAADNTAGPNALSCGAEPLWVQLVAGIYGFSFPACGLAGVPQEEQRGYMFAQPGARVDDVAQQVQAAIADGLVVDRALVTMLAGTNDLLDLHALRGTSTSDQLVAEARARGARLASIVNDLADRGARVLVSTIPNLGLAPLARAPGSDGALLGGLSQAFNESLQLGIRPDGRVIGLVLTDQIVQAIFDGNLGLTGNEVLQPACDPAKAPVAIETCTSGSADVPQRDAAGNVVIGPDGQPVIAARGVPSTLFPDRSAARSLWADDVWPAWAAQQQIGIAAQSRALNNPF
ncbi:MAG: hypothetical protein MUF03_03500 [Rubrivivax sp.]|jgi:hypothetical protein|nr:hypothetical protein [Rubrivivax sp.]